MPENPSFWQFYDVPLKLTIGFWSEHVRLFRLDYSNGDPSIRCCQQGNKQADSLGGKNDLKSIITIEGDGDRKTTIGFLYGPPSF